MEQLSVEDWKPDACPKNITVEEYLATFPKIKLTRREYLPGTSPEQTGSSP